MTGSATVDEDLAALAPDRRAGVGLLRDAIRAAAPDAVVREVVAIRLAENAAKGHGAKDRDAKGSDASP